MKKLKFGKGNKKLNKNTLVYSHPAGITCPGANSCKAFVSLMNDKRVLKRGSENLFTCFAASEELRYPNVFKARRYNLLYLQAWLNVAKLNPEIKFYCYSKSLNLFLEVLLPNNFYMVASYGGRFDYLIDQGYFPKYSKVVFSEDEAIKLGLEIDKDDSLCFGNKPFALLLHGMQEKGSKAGEALKLINRNKKLASV